MPDLIRPRLYPPLRRLARAWRVSVAGKALRAGNPLSGSFLKLLLTGFALAVLPLVAAFLYAAIHVDRLAQQTETAVQQAAEAMRASRVLVERVTSMERIMRQYAILGDAALIESYVALRPQFLRTAAALARLPLDAGQQAALKRIVDSEQRLFARIDAGVAPGRARADLAGQYTDLSEEARHMLDASSDVVDREIDGLRASATRAQRILIVLVATVMPLGFAIAGLFTFFIARPIRQLDAAIRGLGQSDLERRIRINGPQDLVALGERLEWLRWRLAELERQKATFLRHVSHELKTPLTAVREGAELLAEGAAGPLAAPQREIVQILSRSSTELARMIGDLLDYQRAMANLAVIERAPIDLADVAARAVEPHRLAARARGIRLEINASATPITADGEKLRVVMDNLLSNAVKFSPDRGTVHIAVFAAGERAAFDVRDEGPGIAPEERDRVFEWFFQGGREHRGRVRGSGLGLAIARDIVHAHGGQIDLIDDHDHGAHFRVTLQLRRRD